MDEKKDYGRLIKALQIVTGILLLCLMALGIFLIQKYNIKVSNIENLSGMITGGAMTVSLILIGISVLKSFVLIFPPAVLFSICGYILPGFLPALAVNFISVVLSLSIPFFLGRFTGAGMVDTLKKRFKAVRKLDDFVGMNETKLTAIVKFSGIMPGDLSSLLFGAMNISYKNYMLGATLGNIPLIIVYTLFGTLLKNAGERPLVAAIPVAVIIAFVLISAILVKKTADSSKKARNGGRYMNNSGLKTAKRALAVILAAIIALSCFTIGAFASQEYLYNPRFHKISRGESERKFNAGDKFILMFYMPGYADDTGNGIVTRWMDDYETDVYGVEVVVDEEGYTTSVPPFILERTNNRITAPMIAFIENGVVLAIYLTASGCTSGDCKDKFHEFTGTLPNEQKVLFEVTFHQTDARSVFDMVNEFRSSGENWYWNSTDTEKLYSPHTQPLVYDYELEKIAMQRAAEIALSYNSGHCRPNGELFSSAYDSFRVCAENIAAGQGTAANVFSAWREDNRTYSGQGHRRAMLGISDSELTFTAFACACAEYNGRLYWVQEFRNPVDETAVQTAPVDGKTEVEIGLYPDGIESKELTVSPLSYEVTKGDVTALPEVSATLVVKNNTMSYERTKQVKVKAVWTAEGPVTISDGTFTADAAGTATLKAKLLGDEYTIPITIEDTSCDHVAVDDAAVDPTCTQPGLTAGSHCSICGQVLVAQKERPALGHDYSIESIAENATCTKAGSKKITCSRCGDEITEPIPATGHDYSIESVVENATCTTAGSKKIICSKCGDEKTEPIPATGHDYSIEETVEAATCTKPGTKKIICSKCGDEKTEEIPKLSHKPGAPVHVADPSDMTDGSDVVYCTECGEKLSETVRYFTISMINQKDRRQIENRQGIRIKANAPRIPSTCEIVWYVDGSPSGQKGDTFVRENITQEFRVEAMLVNGNGIIARSGEEMVVINPSFFSKIISFFKMLFGIHEIVDN